MNINYTLEEILPHRPPMILLDQIIECDEHSLTAFLEIREDNLFLNLQKQVPVWIGLEYMAQTIGAYVGIMRKEQKKDINIGFLLGTRCYETNSAFFELGTKLYIKADKLYQEGSAGSFDCCIQDDRKNILATAKIVVYQPEYIKQYLL
jgi:predicted hotdog family 3-hydroxylacyl-ACP dehydratase